MTGRVDLGILSNPESVSATIKSLHVELSDAGVVANLDLLFFDVRIESGAQGNAICGGSVGLLRRGPLSGVLGTGYTSKRSAVEAFLISGVTMATGDMLLRCWLRRARLRTLQMIKHTTKKISAEGKTVASMILTVLLFGLINPSGPGWEVAELVAIIEPRLDVFVEKVGFTDELEICMGWEEM